MFPTCLIVDISCVCVYFSHQFPFKGVKQVKVFSMAGVESRTFGTCSAMHCSLLAPSFLTLRAAALSQPGSMEFGILTKKSSECRREEWVAAVVEEGELKIFIPP